jgi:hypothetical protein
LCDSLQANAIASVDTETKQLFACPAFNSASLGRASTHVFRVSTLDRGYLAAALDAASFL